MRFDSKSAWPARIVRWLLAPWMLRPRSRPSAPKKILIVRPDRRVGNQIITSSLVLALAEKMPLAELHYLAPHGRGDLVEGLPGLAAVHVLPRHLFSQLGETLPLLRRLRAERFDVAIDASHWHSFSLTSAVLTRLSGAAWTIGHARPGAAALLDQWLPTQAVQPWPSELVTKVGLLAPLGLSGIQPRTAVPESDGREEAKAWWNEKANEAPRVLLWPSTRKQSTAVHVEDWPRVLDHLPLPEGALVGLGWGPGDEDLVANLLKALHGAGRAAAALPDTSILALGHYMAEADLVISGDTGPLHLAGAVAPKIIGVFRQDDATRWMPRGAGNRAFFLAENQTIEEVPL